MPILLGGEPARNPLAVIDCALEPIRQAHRVIAQGRSERRQMQTHLDVLQAEREAIVEVREAIAAKLRFGGAVTVQDAAGLARIACHTFADVLGVER